MKNICYITGSFFSNIVASLKSMADATTPTKLSSFFQGSGFYSAYYSRVSKTAEMIENGLDEFHDPRRIYKTVNYWNNNINIKKISLSQCELINSQAFMNNEFVTEIILQNCITINDEAFSRCTNLQSISIPKCRYIGSKAFMDCETFSTINAPEVRYIGNAAFENNGFISCSFPKVTTIGSSVFYNANQIKKISFPNLTNVGGRPFYKCDSLEELYFDKLQSFPTIAAENWIPFIESCPKLSMISAPSCTWIGTDCFKSCYELQTVYVPNCTAVGSHVFEGLPKLNNLTIPKLKSINYGFISCSALSSLCLENCSAISNAFRNCMSLESLYLNMSSVPSLSHETWISSCFYNTPMLNSSYLGRFGSIYVPSSLVDTYKAHSQWSYLADRITSIQGGD